MAVGRPRFSPWLCVPAFRPVCSFHQKRLSGRAGQTTGMPVFIFYHIIQWLHFSHILKFFLPHRLKSFRPRPRPGAKIYKGLCLSDTVRLSPAPAPCGTEPQSRRRTQPPGTGTRHSQSAGLRCCRCAGPGQVTGGHVFLHSVTFSPENPLSALWSRLLFPWAGRRFLLLLGLYFIYQPD